MSQRELATLMGRPPQLISEIVRGRRGISAETALQLEAALGTAAHIWVGLDADYRLALALAARGGVAGYSGPRSAISAQMSARRHE